MNGMIFEESYIPIYSTYTNLQKGCRMTFLRKGCRFLDFLILDKTHAPIGRPLRLDIMRLDIPHQNRKLENHKYYKHATTFSQISINALVFNQMHTLLILQM